MANNKMVLFDTNSYRNFVRGKATAKVIEDIADLKVLEAKKNVQATGILVVGLEMLANLAEGEAGFNYYDCLNGVIAMSQHCYDYNINTHRMIPPPFLQILKGFFGKIPDAHELKVQNFAGIIRDFRDDYNKSIKVNSENSNFQLIKTYVDNEEKEFSGSIMNLINGAILEIQKLHPRIADKQLREKLLEYILNGEYEFISAKSSIYATAKAIGTTLTNEQANDRAISMMTMFPLSAGFYKWISHEIVYKNIDMNSKTSIKKRWNWLWDYQVTFAITDITSRGREIILVTSDDDMIRMLTDLGYGDRVYTLDEYISFLNS